MSTIRNKKYSSTNIITFSNCKDVIREPSRDQLLPACSIDGPQRGAGEPCAATAKAREAFPPKIDDRIGAHHSAPHEQDVLNRLVVFADCLHRTKYLEAGVREPLRQDHKFSSRGLSSSGGLVWPLIDQLKDPTSPQPALFLRTEEERLTDRPP